MKRGCIECAFDECVKSQEWVDKLYSRKYNEIANAKAEAYREFAEKITEVFVRYAHLHSYAEGAKKDYIEAVDGTEIEMQSVWDVFALKKNGMAEYEEMNRLQNNIELIEKERLLTELEKDFRLLVKDLTGGGNDDNT
jgi:energy-converting hydrogenase A subunit M